MPTLAIGQHFRHQDFETAYDKLHDMGYTTDQIQEWKGFSHRSNWEQLGIKPGIGDHIATGISKWKRESLIPSHSTTRTSKTPVKSPPPKALPTRPSPSRRGHIIHTMETTEEDEENDQIGNNELHVEDEEEYEAEHQYESLDLGESQIP